VVAEWIMDLYRGFLFLSPSFFANSAAVYTSGLGPVDRGKLFYDGKPILGTNKTIGGVIGAIIGGGMLGISISVFFPEIFSDEFVIDRHPSIDYIWYLGFIQGFAAILGDSMGSFIKRRVDLKPGGPFPIMDQIGFVIIAFLMVQIFVKIPQSWVWVIPLTLIIHFAANAIAYTFGWKSVWW
jgi:CDP-2,3-bis-(O-geranylgeranyl)-sn-glycerol synthase